MMFLLGVILGLYLPFPAGLIVAAVCLTLEAGAKAK
jgi:hypothetical protein